MLRLTQKEFEELVAKGQISVGTRGAPPAPEGPGPKKKAPKYRNRKVFVYESGVYNEKNDAYGTLKEEYDSEIEYRRSIELALLQKAGQISELKRQVPLLISPGFKRRGKTVREIKYVADFRYKTRAGDIVVEDVKGYDRKTGKFRTTQDFRVKWKLLKSLYPEYIFALYGQNGISYE